MMLDVPENHRFPKSENQSKISQKFAKHYIFAGFKNIVGGEIHEYTKLQADSREEAIQRMIEDAEKLDADAIVGVRLTTSMVTQGAAEILAYGTAVKLG